MSQCFIRELEEIGNLKKLINQSRQYAMTYGSQDAAGAMNFDDLMMDVEYSIDGLINYAIEQMKALESEAEEMGRELDKAQAKIDERNFVNEVPQLKKRLGELQEDIHDFEKLETELRQDNQDHRRLIETQIIEIQALKKENLNLKREAMAPGW